VFDASGHPPEVTGAELVTGAGLTVGVGDGDGVRVGDGDGDGDGDGELLGELVRVLVGVCDDEEVLGAGDGAFVGEGDADFVGFRTGFECVDTAGAGAWASADDATRNSTST
jgi:hypothetical protein